MKKLYNFYHSILNNKILLFVACFSMASAFLLLFSYSTSLLSPYYGEDSAIFVTIGRGMLKGKKLYIDLFDHKGPILFWLEATGVLISKSKLGIFLVQALFLTTSLYFVIKISLFFLKEQQIILITLATLLFLCGTIYEGNLSEEYSLPFLLVPLYLVLKYYLKDDSQKKHPFHYSYIYGICLGLIAFIRLNNAAIIIGIIFGFIIIYVRNMKITELLQNAAMVLLGFLTISLPICLYFWYQNSLYEMIYASFLHNIIYASSGFFDKTIYHWLTIFQFLLPCLCAFIYSMKKKKSPNADLNVLIICCVIVTSFSLFLGNTYVHYFIIFLPLFVLCIIFILQIYNDHTIGKITCFLLIVLTLSGYSYTALKNAYKNYQIDFCNSKDVYCRKLKDLATIIPTNERSSVWAYNIDPALYPTIDVLPCYKYFIYQDWHAKSKLSLYEEMTVMLNTVPPKWVLIYKDYCSFTYLNEYLKENYEVVAYDEDFTGILLYHLKSK